MDIDKSENACKKRKLSEDREQPDSKKGETQGLERGSVWMDDGNVVIQAGHMQFRVHKSMLARFSSVFKDMFSLPQPNGHAMEVEGCPVVHLHDPAKDVAYLLSAIYDHGFNFNPTETEMISIDMLSGLLRLANKYDIPSIRTHMLQRLQGEYPTSFEDVDFESILYIKLKSDPASLHVAVINFGHEEGILSILPLSLYYVLCDFSVEEILNGTEIDGCITATLPSSLITPCLVGKDKIEKFMWETYKWLREGTSSAPFCGKSPCRKFFGGLEKEILRPSPKLNYVLDDDWKRVLDENKNLGSMPCSACDKAASTHHEEGRRAVFDKLPSFFGYTSWEEVKKMDRYQL